MINSDDKVKFTVHIGDIKAGDTLCEDNVYTQNLNLSTRSPSRWFSFLATMNGPIAIAPTTDPTTR